METGKHFVLVHGSCHGAWCWYKLVPLLKSAGHKVTALDLAASGVNSIQLDDIDSFSDYIQPLLEFLSSLPQDEKIILVGHSYGGFSISLAMQKFPKKILVAVFVTADMPNCIDPPAALMDEFSKWNPKESQLDCKFVYANGLQSPATSTSFGPAYLETILYRDCSPEDLELAKMLLRPQGIFYEDLARESVLTEGNFGSVNRVFVVCDEDAVMPEEMQQWMIENSPPKEVKCISGAGHMVMLSMPKQLCQCLLEIASTYQ